MTYEDSVTVTKQILNQYWKVRGHFPERLVIHKSSNYWDEERDGISFAASDIPNIWGFTARIVSAILLARLTWFVFTQQETL